MRVFCVLTATELDSDASDSDEVLCGLTCAIGSGDLVFFVYYGDPNPIQDYDTYLFSVYNYI